MAKNTSKTADIPFEVPSKVKTSLMTVAVKGDVVSRYAEACDQIVKAEAIKDELAAQLQETGLRAVFNHNIAVADTPKAMISSVNLVDKTHEDDEDSVDRVMFTWVRKDLKNDPNAVKSAFVAIAAENDVKRAEQAGYWSNYCEEVVSAKFDAKVFNGADGKFDRNRFDKFVKAIDGVCQELGVTTPLTASKIIAPKAGFHDIRFQEFGLETNMLLTAVLPTTTSLKAIRATPVDE
jgi:hypothetical protein